MIEIQERLYRRIYWFVFSIYKFGLLIPIKLKKTKFRNVILKQVFNNYNFDHIISSTYGLIILLIFIKTNSNFIIYFYDEMIQYGKKKNTIINKVIGLWTSWKTLVLDDVYQFYNIGSINIAFVPLI